MVREKKKNGQYETEIPLKNMGRLEEGTEPEENETNAMTTDDTEAPRRKTCHSKKWLVLLLSGLILIIIALVTTYFLYKHFSVKDTANLKEALPLLKPPNPEIPLPPSASTLHVFERGAVCSDSASCSKIGRDIFHRGGNVVDAALATLFCNGIETLQSLGLGGGFIMNVYIKSENKSYTIDGRDVAPLAATKDMFVGKPKGASNKGPLSIAVPGEVLGYWEAHQRFASMPWKEIIEPSIKVCEDGILLTKHMWDSINSNTRIKNDARLRKTFVKEGTDTYHPIGTHIYPPKELCNTYRTLATNGGADFYNGSLAEMVAEDLKEIGSIITLEDLKTYKVEWHPSIPVKLNKNILYASPPIGSGALVGFILNILRGYNFTERNISTSKETALTYHRFIEAFKFAFGRRSDLGDLRFNNLTSLLQNITSLEYANAIREQINDNKTFDDANHYGAHFWSKSQKGTSHMSLIAPNGDAVAVTSTVNYYFGSGHSGRRTGIIFSSGMDDFSTPGLENHFGLPSSKPNFIAPHKRAMSSMCPTIVTDENGDVKLVIGAAGGTKITTAVSLVIARVLWFGQDIKQALDAPRFHHQLLPNEIQYEYGILQEIIDSLESRGHKTSRYQDRGSAMCGLAKNSTAVYANADFRKEGGVAGL